MRVVGTLALAILLAAIALQAQKASPVVSTAQTGRTFRLDTRSPFVYLKFDHIGSGQRMNPNEPPTRIWLHLVNNCQLPIVVRGGQPIDGGMPGEVSIDNVVRLNPPLWGLIVGNPLEPDLPPVATTLTEPGQQPNAKDSSKNLPATSPTQSRLDGDIETSMPVGYASPDVVSTETILPGSDLLFSVPVNFVTKKWHFEIGITLDSERADERSPEHLSFVDPKVRGHVDITLSYGFYDLPREHQDEVEKLNQALQKKQ
jgi:hypothetical protein